MELFNDVAADFCQPLIDYLLAKERGEHVAPYAPEFKPASFTKLCALALMWHRAGFQQEAGKLAQFLLKCKKFPTLWTLEKEYNEPAAKRLYSLLKEIPLSTGNIAEFDVQFAHSVQMNACFTLTGEGTSMGSVLTKGYEIRAFGPQALPTGLFGITGQGADGWARCLANPEVWLEMRERMQDGDCQLNIRFIGLTEPIGFVFYVKCDNCKIGDQILRPKTLHRYQGEGKGVRLPEGSIESADARKIQIIPLAGSGCYWDCEFLISFEINPLDSQIVFTIKS